MKKLLLLSMFFISLFSSTFAANKIYTIGITTGIVADDTEWSCIVSSGTEPLVQGGVYKHVKGTSKHFPLVFVFYHRINSLGEMTVFLQNYAITTNSVLSSVEVKENNNDRIIIEGSYFDNSSSGYFQYYYQKSGQFMMFSKINSEMLDDHTRTFLYNSVHDLITPLYNPKALYLWLESIEMEKGNNPEE